MEVNNNQVQQNATEPSPKDMKGNNTFMIVVILALLVTFGLLIYTMTMNQKLDAALQKLQETTSAINSSVKTRQITPSSGQAVEGADTLNIDTDLQNINADVSGL